MSRSAEAQAEYRQRQRRLMDLLLELWVERAVKRQGDEARWLSRYPPKDRLDRFCQMLEELIAEQSPPSDG
jgi:histone H3/H4